MKEQRPLLFAIKMGLALILITTIVLLMGTTFSGYFESRKSSTPLPVFDETEKIHFVIDPGHGGEDAGAIANDGTLEKDLNFKISTLLFTIFDLNGNNVDMTRTDDHLLYDYYGDLKDYTGQKKVYDLKNRLKFAEEKENSIYVGIHMNKFPEEKYNGLQIYYSRQNPLSHQLAKEVREAVISTLQQQNKRQIKPSNNSIFVLDNAKIPAILIECGFLSNQNELELLKSDAYQKKLCVTLFSALVKHAY